MIGLATYGETSSGRLRRLNPDGQPRSLADEDYNEHGKPKRVRNRPSLVTRVSNRLDPLVDPALFHAAGELLKKRARECRSEGGVADCGRNALTRLVYDSACKNRMWIVPKGNGRRDYSCSTYAKSHGRHCDHNHVDAEAALSFTLTMFGQLTSRPGVRERLEGMLRETALRETNSSESLHRPLELEVRHMEAQFAAKVLECDLASRNLLLVKDGALVPILSAQLAKLLGEQVEQESRLAVARARLDATAVGTVPQSVDDLVNEALRSFEDLQSLSSVRDPEMGSRLNGLFQKVGLRLRLTFTKEPQGKRMVNKLAGCQFLLGVPVDAPEPDGLDGDGNEGHEPPAPADTPEPALGRSKTPADDGFEPPHTKESTSTRSVSDQPDSFSTCAVGVQDRGTRSLLPPVSHPVWRSNT